MGHEKRWLVEGRLASIVYDGDIDVEEMKRINTWLDEFLSTGQSPVHIILDTRKMGSVPTNIRVLSDSLSALQKEGWGWIILIGMNRLVRFFAEVIGNQFHLQIKAVDTKEEAENFIRRNDHALGETL